MPRAKHARLALPAAVLFTLLTGCSANCDDSSDCAERAVEFVGDCLEGVGYVLVGIGHAALGQEDSNYRGFNSDSMIK
jgi:hypothetical protein